MAETPEPGMSDLVAALAVELKRAAREVGAPEGFQPELERPRDLRHGDFATNAALVLAGRLGQPARQVADQLDRAHQILEIGTQLFPDSANAWDSLAEITLHLGNKEKAIEYYRKALEVDPEFSNAADQLKVLTLEQAE